MDLHKRAFIMNDGDHVKNYLVDVGLEKATMSGATMTPAAVVHQIEELPLDAGTKLNKGNLPYLKAREVSKHQMNDMNLQFLEGQWKAIVKQMKESGALESCLAVRLTEMFRLGWELDLRNPNFVSIFRDLILPAADAGKVAPAGMVKRVFVFSDMQFDEAEEGAAAHWRTSYEVIRDLCAAEGYEVPELVFWDLSGNSTTPVTVTDEGTALVIGNSQALLKMFMDGTSWRGEDNGDVATRDEEGDGDTVVVETAETTPRSILDKAIGHPANSMLKAYD
ncbi:hypothetical protein ISF_07832 [Cordyceps fumosorosea ARSEF 2679]|uniref:Uncharacterized protein n=1 Tax=Cordyceps fumosorosea (strain ARSEF 2679) TaxID=1081104 RepID=A0A167NMT7_CORFA|nr:hypothetical protein ISF_07832 [Cordyceps fumosorosea ARSEF 2679]OAA55727.1 hypothetical protein ISF_07832 [Cordyceps fumosorosea ARSEF 2679]